MTGTTFLPRPATSLDDFLVFVLSRNWRIEFTSESFLADECEEVLRAIHPLFSAAELDLLLLLVWSDSLGGWNPATPFLSSAAMRIPIRRYFWLQHHLGILGPTNAVFKLGIRPQGVLSLALGDEFDCQSSYENGIYITRVKLPYRSSNADRLLESILPGSDYRVSDEGEPGEDRVLRVLDHGRPPTDLHELRKSFARAVEHDLDLGSREHINTLLRHLHHPRGIRLHWGPEAPDADQAAKEFQASFVLARTVLELGDEPRELVYLFNSSSIHGVEVSSDLRMQDGGSLALVGRAGKVDYPTFYMAGGTALTKLAAIQKIFRLRAEKRHALRSAIAATMARNLSHNLGSHVLARLATEHAVARAHFGELFLDEMKSDSSKATGVKHFLVEKAVATSAERSSMLNAYLQARMDFVAEIATAQITGAAVALDMIVDVVADLVKQHLVWEHLCASHGVLPDAMTVVVTSGSQELTMKVGQRVDWRDRGRYDVVRDLSFTVGIPNGALGCHAFFCIIENMVRNTVKHSPDPLADLQISICMDELDLVDENVADLVRIVVHDNVRVYEIGDLISSINTRLTEALVDSRGVVIAKNRGLKEMRAAAAYLRELSLAEIESDAVHPPLLKAVQTSEGSLGYEFFLQRAKELLILDSKGQISSEMRRQLIGGGVRLVSTLDELLKLGRYYPLLMLIDPSSNDFAELESAEIGLPLRWAWGSYVDGVVNGAQVGGLFGGKALGRGDKDTTRLWISCIEALQRGAALEAAAQLWKCWNQLLCGGPPPPLRLHPNEDPTAELKSRWDVNEVQLGKVNPLPNDEIYYVYHGLTRSSSPDLMPFFYEPYRSQYDPVAARLQYPPADAARRTLLVQHLIEAAVLPVIVVDERVQGAATIECSTGLFDTVLRDKPLASWMHLLRIYMPRKSVDVPIIAPEHSEERNAGVLDLESPTLTRTEVDRWIEQAIRRVPPVRGVPVLPLLVIHQGILDTIGLRNAVDAGEWIGKIRGSVATVIVTSGRGRPDNVSSAARFIPLSSLATYAVEYRSKLHLIQTLSMSRRI